MDTMTLSSVKSCKKVLFHVPHSFHSIKNLDTTCDRVLNRADSRIQFRRNFFKAENVIQPCIMGRDKKEF